MKKFILSLFAALFLLALQVEAQIPCSSNFTTTFLSSSNVKFIPTVQYSAPTTYHVWTFGDGTPDSTTVSPTHNYTSPGTYVVKHKIQISSNGTNIFCNDSTLQTITISAPCTLQASFTSSPVASNPLTIIFQSTSIGAAPGDSILWTFGDGTATQSSSLNTSHTYASPGTYNACLRIVKMLPNGGGVSNCISDICHPVVIPTSTTCQVQANFNLVPTAGTTNPLLQYFANTSINIVATDSIRWTFGDGASASTFNASHTYANYGVYNVCLRVIKRNPNGVLIPTCVSEYCRLDTIVAPTPQCSVQAAFNIVPTTGLNPLVQYFANTSTNIVATDSIRWTFGDGTGASTFNASHTYANYGTYNVCLRVIKRINGVLQPNCVSEVCRFDTIAAPPCSVQAGFSIGAPNSLAQSFVNLSTGAASSDSIRWTFGDGTPPSNSYNATHTYATYGNYNVCLRIIKRINGVLQPNCVSEICRVDSIFAPVNPCNIQAYFVRTGDTTVIPSIIQFTNQSQGVQAGDTIRWHFGDGGYATGNNPTHTYTAPGTYNVCITIIRPYAYAGAVPCIREYCKTITILQATTVCNVVEILILFLIQLLLLPIVM